jgi:predicted Zn finger-like uncharacterized protein
MRLVCRECSAAYEAPDSLFGPQPREVRCNRCGYQWSVVGTAVPSDAAAAPAPMPMPVPVSASATTSPPGDAPLPLTAAAPITLPPDTARLAEGLPTQPQPPAPPPTVPRPDSVFADADEAAQPPASTRKLLADLEPEFDEEDGPDAEERRLSHELSFGETEYRPTAPKPRRGRGMWLTLLIVIVLIIAAIMFKPQLVDLFPALDGLYAAIGL